MPLTPKSLAFSPASPANIYDSAIFDSPNNPNSSYSEAKNVIRSRGFTALQKAKQNNHGTTDLVGVCSQWNIRIIHVQKVTSFISKCKLLYQKKNDENKVPQEKVHSSGGELYPPFIKVEDLECKYKPHYKMFATWKDAVDKKLCQVVSSLQTELQINVVGKPLKLNQSSNSDNLTFLHINSLKDSPIPSYQSRMTQNSVLQNSVSLNFTNAKQKYYPGILPKSARQAREKRKSVAKKKYCEICSCSFVTLEEHIMTDFHRRFMRNRENFKAIEDIVATLPNLKDFLQANEMAAEQVKGNHDPKSSSISQEDLVTENTENVLSKSLIQISPSVIEGKTTVNSKKEIILSYANNDDTEEYLLKSGDIVSASCISDDMETQYPFLEGNVKCFVNNVKQPFVAPGLEVTNFNPHSKKYAFFEPAVTIDANKDMYLQEVQKEATANISLFAAEEVSYNAVESPSIQNVDPSAIFLENYENCIAKESNCDSKPKFENLGFQNGGQTLLHSNNQPLKSKKNSIEQSFLCTSGLPSVAKGGGSVIRKFPFTNFGFGWSPLKTRNEIRDIMLQNSDAGFNNFSDDDSNYSSESNHFLKDLRSNVDNLCKSLEVDDKSSSALDLSIPKPCESKNSEVILGNTVSYNLPLNDRESLITITA